MLPVQDHEALPTAPATPEPVEIAGRYRVIETLGSGGWGVVYKAWDRTLHRTVAIKAVRLERLVILGVHRDEVLRRFEREATTAAGLNHPGIVTIYDVGTWQGAPYQAMEFVEGVSLDRLLAREGRLSPERSALLALEVAEALEHAHARGVLHRDVKPQNVIVPHERSASVKLVDFGLAKAMDCTDHLTRTGTFLGTPSYASPEQLMGEVVDGRSDVWAVGCVLYEMLTGEKAFAGKGITSLIVQIMTVEPPPVRELDPALPEDLARIVHRAMAKTREERHAGAAALAADLRLFVRSHGAGEATPPLEVAAVPREEAAEPEATVVASAAELGMAAATTLSGAAPTVQVPRSPTGPRSPTAPVPRSPTVQVPRSARRQRRAVRLWPALGLAALVTLAAGLAAMRWVSRNAARNPDASATVAEAASAPAEAMSTMPPVSTLPSLVSPPPTAAAPEASPPLPAAAPVASPPPPAAARVARPGPLRPAPRPRAAPPEEAAGTSSGPPGAKVSMDGALPAPVAAAPDPNRIYTESEVDVRPQKLALRLPSHPERLVPALKKGEAISVALSLVVGVDGSVSDVKVDRSSGITAVDEAVTKALAGARFRAGEKGGVPVRTRVIFVFTFRGA